MNTDVIMKIIDTLQSFKVNVAGGTRAPVLISHQRQLSLSVSQVRSQPIRGLSLTNQRDCV